MTLETQYSEISDFPFLLGDQVFLENIVTLDQSQGGFNSENYNYAYFTVIRRDPKLGGSGAFIDLNFTGFLDSSIDEPAETRFFQFDTFLSTSARVIPVKFLPTFETKLIKNEFLEEESVLADDELSKGLVVKWNSANDYIFLDVDPTLNKFKNSQTIIGQTSQTKGVILNIIDFNSRYKIDSNSIVNEGWIDEKGFIANPLQRIHDNDYYQYFSYAVNSEVPQQSWDDAVANLNHTAGFKRFSDLTINSLPKSSGISTSQDTGTAFGINDIIGNVSVNCTYDFDLTRELTFALNNSIKSNQIVFNSRILRDYIESISNRVLPIDDISKNFRSDPRDTPFSIINRTDNTSIRSKKYFLFIIDRQDNNLAESLIINSIQDGTDVYLTQYGRVETVSDLGFFEGLLVGDSWNLLFYPVFADENNYLLDFVAFELTNETDDLETVELGSVATLTNQLFNVPVGFSTAATVVGIASTQRAAKIQLQLSNESRTQFELNEITVLHDGLGNVEFLEYGELVTNPPLFYSSPGIGTYGAQMNDVGDTLEVKFTPNAPLVEELQFKSIVTSIGISEFTSTNFLSLEAGEVRSINVSIAASDAPKPINVVGGYSSQYKTTYNFAVVHDTLNNQYRASELQLVSDQFNSYLSEYGVLDISPVGIGSTFVGIGTFTSELSGSNTNLIFTPLPYIPVEVSIFQMSIGRF